LLRFLCQLNIKREEVAMALTWCSQGRWRGASRAAWDPGNRGADAGSSLEGSGVTPGALAPAVAWPLRAGLGV